jgi:hypothetical protein
MARLRAAAEGAKPGLAFASVVLRGAAIVAEHSKAAGQARCVCDRDRHRRDDGEGAPGTEPTARVPPAGGDHNPGGRARCQPPRRAVAGLALETVSPALARTRPNATGHHPRLVDQASQGNAALDV